MRGRIKKEEEKKEDKARVYKPLKRQKGTTATPTERMLSNGFFFSSQFQEKECNADWGDVWKMRRACAGHYVCDEGRKGPPYTTSKRPVRVWFWFGPASSRTSCTTILLDHFTTDRDLCV